MQQNAARSLPNCSGRRNVIESYGNKRTAAPHWSVFDDPLAPRNPATKPPPPLTHNQMDNTPLSLTHSSSVFIPCSYQHGHRSNPPPTTSTTCVWTPSLLLSTHRLTQRDAATLSNSRCVALNRRLRFSALPAVLVARVAPPIAPRRPPRRRPPTSEARARAIQEDGAPSQARRLLRSAEGAGCDSGCGTVACLPISCAGDVEAAVACQPQRDTYAARACGSRCLREKGIDPAGL